MIPECGDDRKSILVTGAAGFVGRAVAALLKRSAQRVVLLDQVLESETKDQSLCSVACDITDTNSLRRVFEKGPIGGIIHLAAILPTAASSDPVRATEVNVTGSLNLLELAREFRVSRFVFGSSLSIYGSCMADDVVSEAHGTAPEDVYGAAKLYVEQLGERYADLYGIEFVSLRIGRVIGAGARSTTSSWRSEIFEFLRDSHSLEIQIPYAASERILLVHVEDVAAALIKLVQAPRLEHSTYNAPCESVVVADLKQHVESLNPNITVVLRDAPARGNPRRVDASRFQHEFEFETLPIFERLKRSACDNAR